MEMKYELIKLLQEVIEKRPESKRKLTVSALIGHISDNRIKTWFKNQFKRPINHFSLSDFIQHLPQYFDYHRMTGHISVNNRIDVHDLDVLTNKCETQSCVTYVTVDQREEPIVHSYKPLVKPKLLEYLEDKNGSVVYCLTNSQKLSAIEIIVYVFNTLRFNKISIDSKTMYALIREYLPKQLSAMGLCRASGEESQQWLVFNNVLMELKDVFCYKQSKQTINIYFNDIELVNEIDQMLTNSLDIVFKNYLMTQFEKFGRKRVKEIERNLMRDHHYLYTYLFNDGSDYRIIDFVERFQKELTVDYECTDAEECNPIVDISPQLLSDKKRLDFKLMYIFGNKVENFEGILEFIRGDTCLIRVKVKELNSDIHFKVKRDVVKVFGLELDEHSLKVFLHTGDRVLFNANVVFREDPKSHEVRDHLWSVTRINRVTHSAHCFLDIHP